MPEPRKLLELRSHVFGRWVEGSGARQTLFNPATEEPLATAASGGVDLSGALDHARRVGGPALRAMSFAERGALLKAAAGALQQHRTELLELGIANGGNTRSDAKFDVDGAIATLLAYAEVGAGLGAARFLVDGEGIQLGRSPRFHGQHVAVPRHGVAVHINAFNFPVWGMLEKLGPTLLAGVPAIVKPASATSYLTEAAFRVMIEANILTTEDKVELLDGYLVTKIPQNTPKAVRNVRSLFFCIAHSLLIDFRKLLIRFLYPLRLRELL